MQKDKKRGMYACMWGCVEVCVLIKTEMKGCRGRCRKSLGERILCAHQRGFTDEEVKGPSSLLPRSLFRLPRRLVLIAVVQYCKFPPSARGPCERHKGGGGEGGGLWWGGEVKVLTGFKERLRSVFRAQTENGEKAFSRNLFQVETDGSTAAPLLQQVRMEAQQKPSGATRNSEAQKKSKKISNAAAPRQQKNVKRLSDLL